MVPAAMDIGQGRFGGGVHLPEPPLKFAVERGFARRLHFIDRSVNLVGRWTAPEPFGPRAVALVLWRTPTTFGAGVGILAPCGAWLPALPRVTFPLAVYLCRAVAIGAALPGGPFAVSLRSPA